MIFRLIVASYSNEGHDSKLHDLCTFQNVGTNQKSHESQPAQGTNTRMDHKHGKPIDNRPSKQQIWTSKLGNSYMKADVEARHEQNMKELKALRRTHASNARCADCAKAGSTVWTPTLGSQLASLVR